MVKRFVRKLLGSAGYELFNTRQYYSHDGLFTSNNDQFRHGSAFKAAYARGVAASCGVDPHIEWRVHVALWAAAAAVRLPGDFVECGVNAGFTSSAIMHGLNWRTVDKRFYLIDTFTGPVLAQYSREEIDQGVVTIVKDAISAGAYVTDFDRIHANYSEWPGAELVKGVVPDVLGTLHIGNVAFLHIDMNCAHAERTALEFFWNRLSPGAFVLLDDYAYFGYECQKRAIDATAQSLGIEILSLPTGQGLIVK